VLFLALFATKHGDGAIYFMFTLASLQRQDTHFATEHRLIDIEVKDR
jgi:hypothetical protein